MRAALLTLLLALCVPLPAGQAAAAPPRRVVSLNLLLDQWVMLLADEGQVAALTELSRSPNYSPLFEKARRLPAIRGTAEEVLRRKPDLVLAGRWGASETVALLEKCGVPVRVFDYPE
ncbi:MAG: hypothetical protein LBR12_05660, partial [Opitutaceae bacterium]|nr:hypothetical protein [Opitutaceae bacterium]